MGTGVAIGAGLGLASSWIQSESARSAGRSQTRAYERSQRSIRAAAEEAKADILDRMVPALAEYQKGVQQAQGQISAGNFNVIQTLQQYAGNADQIISDAGIDAQKAIMGSSAIASGVPMSQFNTAYTNAENAPPTARNTMMQQLNSAFGASPPQTTASPAGDMGVALPAGAQRPTTLGGTATGATVPQMTAQQKIQSVAPMASNIAPSGPGYTGAMNALQTGYGLAQTALDTSTAQARQDVLGSTAEAKGTLETTKSEGLGQLSPYTDAGRAAMAKEAALSGALGPEAQQQAINSYIESPGQKYLREQQEKSLLRNQAAIGGLGGGNVLTALQKQAMDIASTQQQQYLENLRSIATRGQGAAETATGLIGQTGLASASLESNVGNILAQLAQQYGISSANLAQMSSSEMAQLAERTGINLANLQQATAAARAGLQTELGSGIAGSQASSANAIANLTQTGATNALNVNQNIGTTLANLATGAGTNIANIQAAQGTSAAASNYLQGQAWAQGLTGLGNLALYYGNRNSGTGSSGEETINPWENSAYLANPQGQSMNYYGASAPYF